MSTENTKMSALVLGALGVVFGDIGTSPLYALRECFSHNPNIPLNQASVYGILSLIIWALITAICIKYMLIVMRADNRGEGGILSLMALASQGLHKFKNSYLIVIIFGLCGAALLYGDGVITPAISVLSAVEGLALIAPQMSFLILPVTVAIITALFLFQQQGTAKIGFIFGPLILFWFIVLGALGIRQIIQHPEVLLAVNPLYAIRFLMEHSWVGAMVLASVVLAITGGEALYADMGHFGKTPIRYAWFLVAMPGLVLNYFGQGALILNNPETLSAPFYLLAPVWAKVPLVILATLATVIASQALITGVFSLTRQAVQLGFCPRLQIVHTSHREIGQIYIPAINWALYVGVVWLVLSFRSSSSLASAYGIAVTGTMVITTLLAAIVAVRLWKWPMWSTLLVFVPLFIFDVSFFAPNLMKVAHGGWVPLVIGVVIFLLMTTWQEGRKILAQVLRSKSVDAKIFIEKVKAEQPPRVPGFAVYMSSEPSGVPIPLLHNYRHNKVIHEKVILLTIMTREVPTVAKSERVSIDDLGMGFYRVIACYGFMETPKIRHILEALRAHGLDVHIEDSTFVLGRETILASSMPGMAIWREKLFAIMSKNAARPTVFFKIPPNQVIEVGIQVEI